MPGTEHFKGGDLARAQEKQPRPVAIVAASTRGDEPPHLLGVVSACYLVGFLGWED